MNERLIIRLKHNDVPLRLDSLSSEGVIINSERDAWPRALTLEFDADNSVTRLRMDTVRQVKGWRSTEYKLALSLQDGALVMGGVDAKALPAGRYWLKLRIGDLILPNERIHINLKNDRDTLQDVSVKIDRRQVELSIDSPDVDQQILRVLSDSKSGLDGLSLKYWLQDTRPRPSRKACLLNLLAKLRGATVTGETLLTHVQEVFFADVDRCFTAIDGALLSQLQTLAASPGRPFSKGAESLGRETALRKPLHPLPRPSPHSVIRAV